MSNDLDHVTWGDRSFKVAGIEHHLTEGPPVDGWATFEYTDRYTLEAEEVKADV